MTVNVLKPTYVISHLGEFGQMPDGSVINIGGTINPTFTVGGKPLLFADGTSTAPNGPPGGAFTLQKAYDNSQTGLISLTTAKPFGINSLNGNQLIVDAATGNVNLTAELAGVAKFSIAPKLPTVVPISIVPTTGITLSSDLIQLWNSATSQAPAFSVSAAGDVSARLFNGVNLVSFYAQFSDHISSTQGGNKHPASQIAVNQTNLINVVGSNVQQVIESIDSKLSSSIVNGVQGIEYQQITPSQIWNISHNKNSKRIQITIWDTDDQTIFADTVTIVDENSVRVVFNSPMVGRAVLMVF